MSATPKPPFPAPGRPRSLGERLYRLAIRAYPRRFLAAHRAAMIAFYRDRRRELRRDGRRLAGLRLALEMASDLLRSVPLERRRSASCPHPVGSLMRVLLSDLRFAARALRARPGFTLTVVGILALAIGANAGVFALVDEVLLAPLPYSEPDRLVRIRQVNSRYELTLSMADLLAILERQNSFEAVGALDRTTLGVRSGNRVRSADGARVTAGLLEALRLEVAAGRNLLEPDNRPGAPATALLSWRLAGELFGDPRDAPGSTVYLDARPHTVAGVLPAGVRRLAGVEGDVWPALALEPPSRRGPFGMIGVGRLRGGTTLETAAGELGAISRAIFPLWADGFQDEEATFVPMPLRDALVGEVRQPLLALAAAVAIVLAIALANVANLVLARATSRRRELAVRSALGASRAGLFRLVAAEGMLLGVAGALAALPLAVAVVHGFRSRATTVPRIAEAAIDGRTVAFALGVGVLAGIVVAAMAAAALGGRTGRVATGVRGTTGDAGHERLRGALIVAEFALALPLLVGAALLIASLLNLARVPLGFDPDGLLATRIQLPASVYEDVERVFGFWSEATDLLEQVPGVASVGLVTGLPPDSPRWFNNFDLADRPVENGTPQPVAPWSQAAPGALEVLGVPLLQGRSLQPGDDFDSGAVALVSESWARRHYPGESAVGRRMYAGGCTVDTCGDVTVVGVVGDVKFAGLDAGSEAVYTPLAQEPSRVFWLLVRAADPGGDLAPRLTDALRSLDDQLPPPVWSALEDRVDAALATPRAWTALVAAFASVSVALAAVGIFGVLSYLVGRRASEIGIRMALGANRARVQRMVVATGLRTAALGLLVGLALTLWVRRALDGMLFEVAPGDPRVLLAMTVVLLGIGALASWLPARRAARTDAASVMRAD